MKKIIIITSGRRKSYKSCGKKHYSMKKKKSYRRYKKW